LNEALDEVAKNLDRIAAIGQHVSES